MEYWLMLNIYFLIGLLFIISVKADLNNELYRDLTLYYYNWSKTIQQQYIIYMFVVVFLLWPILAIAFLLDIVGVKKSIEEEYEE